MICAALVLPHGQFYHRMTYNSNASQELCISSPRTQKTFNKGSRGEWKSLMISSLVRPLLCAKVFFLLLLKICVWKDQDGGHWQLGATISRHAWSQFSLPLLLHHQCKQSRSCSRDIQKVIPSFEYVLLLCLLLNTHTEEMILWRVVGANEHAEPFCVFVSMLGESKVLGLRHELGLPVCSDSSLPSPSNIFTQCPEFYWLFTQQAFQERQLGKTWLVSQPWRGLSSQSKAVTYSRLAFSNLFRSGF